MSWNLLRFMYIESMILSNPASLPPPSTFTFNLSHHQDLFQWTDSASGGQIIGASASASVLPMNIQGWFPFRTDWFDLLVVQGTLKNLFYYCNSKASMLWCSAFFISHPHISNLRNLIVRWIFSCFKTYISSLQASLRSGWSLSFNRTKWEGFDGS